RVQDARRAAGILAGLAVGLARPAWEPAVHSRWRAAPAATRRRLGHLPPAAAARLDAVRLDPARLGAARIDVARTDVARTDAAQTEVARTSTVRIDAAAAQVDPG
ncbi:hypothetical protein ND748_16450, partial [Frankia sp. AiPs1]|nr:hypothetical protein [Frankia sp. AiPs1]